MRVLVARFHPRKKGFRKGIGYDLWLRGLSPGKGLLKAYRQGSVTREQFKASYLEQLREGEGNYESETGSALYAIRALLSKCIDANINNIFTLLCYEPEDGRTFCHRHVLKDYL